MHILPIAERELRVASRRPRTYWARLTGAGIALALASYLFWLFNHVVGGVGFGRQMFGTLSQFAFVYCLFCGVGSTADCLSSEKRGGTLGLLFLTQLHSYDVVLGKLLATSLHSVYGVLAIVPVFALCLLTGGVQVGEFWRTVLAQFNTLFFSLSVGLLVSASTRQERRAAQTTSGVMVGFGFVLPLIGEYLRTRTNWIELGIGLRVISPTQMFDASTIPTAGVRYFWWSLGVVHLLAWLALGLACWILPRAWQDRPLAEERAGSWRQRLRQWSLGSLDYRRAFRSRLLDRNPIYWLAARSRLLQIETWTIVGGVVVLAAWSGWFFHAVVPVFVVALIAVVTLHSILKMQVGAAACDRLAEDKQQGTLELILSTPLPVSQFLSGQWLALGRQFTAAFLAVTAISLVLLLLVLTAREPDFISDGEAASNCVWAFLAASIMLIIDGVALAWVGMWQALSARHGRQARSRALFFILFLPWIVLLLLISIGAVYGASGAMPWMRDLKFQHFLGAWFTFGVANDLIFAGWARRQLLIRFRLLATERFQVGRTDWLGWKAITEPGNARA